MTARTTLYDPERGNELYNRYLDELELADQLGFDGICVNEHHQNAYGLMPSPNIMAAALARRTSRAKLVILGNVLTLYDHPLRVAEELAMLDVISGGRIVSGLVVGTGNEYFSSNVNPTYARERFREAHELIVKAWTEPGPFAWGKHYRFRYVNVWPRPMQQPHPPIWIPGSGRSRPSSGWRSNATPTWCCRRWRHSGARGERRAVSRACERHGYTARHDQIGWGIGVYVSETDAQAVAEYEPHFWKYAGTCCGTATRSMLRRGTPRCGRCWARWSGDGRDGRGISRRGKRFRSAGYVVVGSPETVRERLLDIARATRAWHAGAEFLGGQRAA